MDSTTIASTVDTNAIDKAVVNSDGTVTLPGASVAINPADIQAEIAGFQAQIVLNNQQIQANADKSASLTQNNTDLQASIAADQALLTSLENVPGVVIPPAQS